MSRVQWITGKAKECSIGRMRCDECHEKITEGVFRYRDNKRSTGYIIQHALCAIKANLLSPEVECDVHEIENITLPEPPTGEG